MSLYEETVPQFSKMLGNLDRWLQEAIDYAEERGFDPEVLLDQRLSPDQFNLRRQIQTICDTGKLTPARLAGVEAPKHEDGPQTLAELRTRIGEVREFIDGLDEDAVNAGVDRVYQPTFAPGMEAEMTPYVREFGVPNFYFHVTTAYAILRSHGVKLGKRTFLGSVPLRPIAD